MTTERDVYEIETATAVENVDKLKKSIDAAADGVKKKKAETEGLASFLEKDLKASIFSASAAYDILKSSVQSVAHFVKDSVGAFLEAEQAQMRLSVALRNINADSPRLLASLDAQSTAIERLTGLDDEYIKGLQSMLTTMGVAPQLLERFTKASINLSIATGQDATSAAKMLARANAEGKEDLNKYGIQLDDTTFKARGFAYVLDEVDRRYGNMAESQPELVKQTNALKGAWSSFSEVLGEVAIKFLAFGEKGDKVVTLIDSLTDRLKNANTEGARFKLLMSSAFPFLAPLATGGAIADLFGKASPTVDPNAPVPPPSYMLNGGIEVDIGEASISDAEQKRLEAARKVSLEKARKYREEMDALMTNGASNLAKLEEEENRKMMERVTKMGDWEEQNFQEQLKSRQQMDVDALEIIKSQEEERQRLMDAKLEKEKQHWQGMKDAARGYFDTFIASQLNFIQESLTYNTSFHRQMFEAELQRKTAGKSDLEVQAERAKMEREIASERASSYLKMTADALASISQQAAVKAIYEGVEAIAALATGNPAGAALHGAAAAGYAGVAVVAGGTAAAISSARGLTGDERNQLESATKTKADRKEREDKAKTERGQAAGTIVNVYNLGITGQTDVEQGKELARIQKQYEATRTGGM